MATISEVVPLYIKLRDKIEQVEKEQKETLKPLKAKLEMLDGWLLGELTRRGEQSVHIKDIGTVFVKRQSSCSVADWDATFAWLSANNRWDMLNHAVNKTVVAAYVETEKEAPPGVKFDTFLGVQVNRERGT